MKNVLKFKRTMEKITSKGFYKILNNLGETLVVLIRNT